MPRGPKPGVQRKHGADMTVDDTILKALEGGPVTVNDILKLFGRRVRIRLDKLRSRGVVWSERAEAARTGSSLTDCYVQTSPRRRTEKGGLAAKVIPERRQRRFVASLRHPTSGVLPSKRWRYASVRPSGPTSCPTFAPCGALPRSWRRRSTCSSRRRKSDRRP
jgi:hypothetical protein